MLILSKNKQTQELEIELNKIHKSISEIMRHTEKKCSYVPTQNLLHWSPTLKNALNGLKSACLLRTKMQFIQPGQIVSEVKANYVAACKTYDEALAHCRDVQTRHVELRKEYLKELANDLALKNQTSQACERFFENCNLTTIHEWKKNVMILIERNNRKIKKITTCLNTTMTTNQVERQEQISLAAEFRKQMKTKKEAIQNRIQQNISSLFSRLKY